VAAWLSIGTRASPHYFCEKSSLFQFQEGLPKFRLRIHHDGSIPRHRLAQRLARNEQESNALRSDLHRDFVTAIKQNETAVFRFNL
jgi:hypothetical protein